MTDYNDVPVEDDSIKLGQFLKLANLIESGGEAKRVLAGGIVRVTTARSRMRATREMICSGVSNATPPGARPNVMSLGLDE